MLSGILLVATNQNDAPTLDKAILGASYSVPALNGATVFDSMTAYASSSSSFSFKERSFEGLGYFIDEIGGRKNADGFYWTLYVNGIYSDKGASNTVLEVGDLIEWKYEKK